LGSMTCLPESDMRSEVIIFLWPCTISNITIVRLRRLQNMEQKNSTKERLVRGSQWYSSHMLMFTANHTINAVKSAGGIMTLDDLKNYKATIREPISITYKGYKLYSCGVPSGGSVALSILKIIEGYEMSGPELRNLSYHRLDEAMRFSYAARTELGDPDFFKHMGGFEAQMLMPRTASNIRDKISDCHTHNVSYYGPQKYSLPENHGTSHIVATDASGMSVTLTSTINLLFGSLLVVPETGIASHILFLETLFTECRSNNERRNERLLHPRHPQRIWLRPLPDKLHSPQQAPPLLHLPNNSRAPKWHALPLHWRRRRKPHHHFHCTIHLACSGSRDDASGIVEDAEVA